MAKIKETKIYSAKPGDSVGICSHFKAWISMMVAFLNNSKIENTENRTYNRRNQNNNVSMQMILFVFNPLSFVN